MKIKFTKTAVGSFFYDP